MKTLCASLGLATLLAITCVANATPQQDLKEFQSFYMDRFPDTPFDDFVNGVYSIDPASREQWEDIEEFAPYELNISVGEIAWLTPFQGFFQRSYTFCFCCGIQNELAKTH